MLGVEPGVELGAEQRAWIIESLVLMLLFFSLSGACFYKISNNLTLKSFKPKKSSKPLFLSGRHIRFIRSAENSSLFIFRHLRNFTCSTSSGGRGLWTVHDVEQWSEMKYSAVGSDISMLSLHLLIITSSMWPLSEFVQKHAGKDRMTEVTSWVL